MKTATEMADFCKENNTGSGTSKKWTKKHFGVVEKQLKPNEEVLFAFVGLFNYVSTTNHESNYAIAITNERIIACQKKMMGENVKIILRRNLNDITKSTGMIFGILTIDTIKETFNVATNKQEIDVIHEGINNILFADEEVKEGKTQSVVEQLKEFKELLDMEIITQEEFNQKKAEILG
ncbi:MAG TPA: PH domain-containing protein [Candidatus Atopostipes pullistercoris]|uniref:PH domain-containing protein n=1 Tax=Candidatus Atopostipes pullistercoris TaxID=2838467 RepID=A0A9D2FZI5_9LACT|nr:PH domain-containing protein [Candidatus Atopostipes pullistercoris]